MATRLECTSASRGRDAELVSAAIAEARGNVETYVKRAAERLVASRLKLRESTEALNYFVQTNHAASIEAAVTFPKSGGWILRSVVDLDRDAGIRRRTDRVIA